LMVLGAMRTLLSDCSFLGLQRVSELEAFVAKGCGRQGLS
jgi:hypothetical protein